MSNFSAAMAAGVMFSSVLAFQSIGVPMPKTVLRRTPALSVHSTRDFDPVGDLIGGVRYALVPMPEAMKETTAYVGNLCEFVHDDDLSNLFAEVSSLISVPSCVVRKIDTTSLRYGFVAFPTVQEKEAAIIRFDGFEWKGKRMKVECIRDHPKRGSVRIPESMVDYVYGTVRTTTPAPPPSQKPQQQRSHSNAKRQHRNRTPTSINSSSTSQLTRALRRGYVTLESRKQRSLVQLHRQYCAQMEKPQIIMYKAVGNALDRVVVDISPLRLPAEENATDRLNALKTEMLHAASGMTPLDVRDEACDIDSDVDCESSYATVENTSANSWSTLPIDQLPMMSLGTFQGERTKTKEVASALAKLWDIPAEVDVCIEQRLSDAERGSNGRNKKKDRKRHTGQKRKRGGGHRQAWNGLC